MSYTAIKDHITEMYQLEVSEATISSITDQLIPQLKAWQSRPLDSIYPFVWLDAIHYKVKDEGRYVNKAVFAVIIVGLFVNRSWIGSGSFSKASKRYRSWREMPNIVAYSVLFGNLSLKMITDFAIS